MKKNHFDLKIVFENHNGFLDTSTDMVMFYGRVFKNIKEAVNCRINLNYWKSLSSK